MSISLCCIVKNEEHVIAEMLASVQGVADELVVVDTGSTDATVEIARSYGARIDSFKWCDDFAKARNFSLGLATSDWILVLDADERLESADRPQVLEICRDLRGDKAYYTKRRHYQDNTNFPFFTRIAEGDYFCSLGARGYYITNDIRIFPNNKAVSFQGALHESAEDSLRACAQIRILDSDICIHHIGALFQSLKQSDKSNLYLSLAKKKLASNPDDWRNWFQLGVELFGQGDFLNAAVNFKETIRLEPGSSASWRQLGFCLIARQQFSEALPVLQTAAEKNSNCPMTWNALGVCFRELGLKDQARLCFRTAVQIDPQSEIYALNLKSVEF